MDKKLDHLKESMDHTVLKGLEFNEEHRKKVFRSIKAKKRQSRFAWIPKIASVNAAASVLACAVLLLCSLYFVFGSVKDEVQAPMVHSSQSMLLTYQKDGTPVYVIYFDEPQSFTDISSLQKHMPYKLLALKYTFPLSNRLPEAGTYILDKNEPITVAATSAENQLKSKLKDDIRDLDRQVNGIKTEKQLIMEKPMLNDVINLLELKKALLDKIESESIRFSAVVVTINVGWLDKLKNIDGVAGIEPYNPDQSPLDEPYPADETIPNNIHNNLPSEPIYAISDTKDGQIWSYSYHHLYYSNTNGFNWAEIGTLNIGEGVIANAAFIEEYIRLYVKENGNAYMYLSDDKAKTWKKVKTPFTQDGHLFFLNKETGWYLDDTGYYNGKTFNRLFSTEDGGLHWTEIASSAIPSEDKGTIPFEGVKTNIVFIDKLTGWMTTTEPGGTQANLYQTNDGGKTWSDTYFNRPSGFGSTQNTIFGPYFYDRKNGFFVFNARSNTPGNSSFVFYKTTDGGKSWQMTQPMNYPYTQDVRVDVTRDKAFVTDGKTLYETKDMGENWMKSGMVFDGQTNRVVAPLSLIMTDDQHSVLLIRESSDLTRTLISMGEISHWQTLDIPASDHQKE
ncbi:MAG: hypothetical protein ACO1OC_02810 [Tuberibacillus sp.]